MVVVVVVVVVAVVVGMVAKEDGGVRGGRRSGRGRGGGGAQRRGRGATPQTEGVSSLARQPRGLSVWGRPEEVSRRKAGVAVPQSGKPSQAAQQRPRGTATQARLRTPYLSALPT